MPNDILTDKRPPNSVIYYCICPHSFNGVLDSINPKCDTHRHELELERLCNKLHKELKELQTYCDKAGI